MDELLGSFMMDTSVALNYFLRRPGFFKDVEMIIEAVLRQEVVCYVSATTLTSIFYLIEKNVSSAAAFAAVDFCLKNFKIASVDEEVLRNARAMVGSDYEDNVQIAAAIKASVTSLITEDKKGFRASPIPVYTQAAWLAQHQQQGA